MNIPAEQLVPVITPAEAAERNRLGLPRIMAGDAVSFGFEPGTLRMEEPEEKPNETEYRFTVLPEAEADTPVIITAPTESANS